MPPLKVLVVGASIAGPTTAYWFAKAGAQVTIIERFPQLRTSGQSIDIRTAGLTVMRRMDGMEDAVRAKSTGQEGIQFVNADGKPFATMTTTGDTEAQSLVGEYEIFRGDLARILYDMTKDDENITYIFNEQVASMRQTESEKNGLITVEFMNGTPSADFDLVVACDGSTSRTRALGFNCGVRTHIEPTNCWAAYFSIPHDLLKGSRMAQAHSAVGGRFIAIGPDTSKQNRVGVMNLTPKSADDATLPFREALKEGMDALKRYVASQYADVGWKTPELMAAMMETEDFYGSELVQVKVPSLYKGRFVLVGDAGYAPGFTGTGTSLAMAGAYLLAGEISRHKDDLAVGLKAYEERMQPLITDMQKIPPGTPGIFAPQTAWGIWWRNLLFKVVCWGMQFGWLFGGLGGMFASSFGGDKYGLPIYEWMR